MPCDQIRESTINLGKVGDKALLMKALAELGYRAQINGETIVFGQTYNGGIIHADGRVELRGNAASLDENAIKRAYSTEAVKLASQKFGWKLEAKGEGKFVAIRRS